MSDRKDPYTDRVEMIVDAFLNDNEKLTIDELFEKYCQNIIEYKLGNRAWKDFKIDVIKTMKHRK